MEDARNSLYTTSKLRGRAEARRSTCNNCCCSLVVSLIRLIASRVLLYAAAISALNLADRGEFSRSLNSLIGFSFSISLSAAAFTKLFATLAARTSH